MSIATYISAIESDRNTIRNKLVELGLATSTDKLNALAAAIEDIVNRGAVSITVQEGDTYTIPAGYHNGSGTVSGVAGGGNYSLQSKSATPTKKQQNITPDNGYYGLSDVTVAAIPEAYQDVTSVTAAAGNVLSGKVFVTADGTVTPGTMVNNGAVDKTIDVTTVSYTIPAGYHNGSGKVKLVVQTKTATPTKSTQTIKPDSGKVLSQVTIDPIPDAYQDVTSVTATAPNVLDGDVFVDAEGTEVEGTMPNNGAVSKTLDTTTNNQSYTVPKGYHSGTGKVGIVLEDKGTVTPTKSAQTITPAAGKVMSKVIVGAIPAAYQDVTGVTAGAGDVLDNKYFVTAAGVKTEGTMPNNGAIEKTMDGLTTTSVTVPAGYHNGTGTVSLTSDIEEALAAI